MAKAREVLGMTHQDIAAHVGTVRKLVSRNLARLQAQRFINVYGREITILIAML